MQRDRISATYWFATIGVGAIVAGGVAAAAIAHAPTRHGVWAVAYLVLVAGVAQVGLGVGQSLLATQTPAPRLVTAELFAWNVGNAAVIVGTIAGVPSVVYVGGALLVLGLALFVFAARGGQQRWRRTRWAYRLVVLILLVSIPIGLTLAQARR